MGWYCGFDKRSAKQEKLSARFAPFRQNAQLRQQGLQENYEHI